MAAPRDGLLAGYRLLDLAGGQGALCARLFADLGADVVKVEPVGGCPSRRMPPFCQGRADLDASLWFRYYNTGKRSVTLNLDTETGREPLRAIVRRLADLVKDEHLAAQGFVRPLDQRERGGILVGGIPLAFSGMALDATARCPVIGEDTAGVLIDGLGLDPDEIARLQAARVVEATPSPSLAEHRFAAP